jgi:serine/threonine protein phosphatase 1
VWNLLQSPARRPRARPLEGIRIYAIGDIHGRADLLDQLLRRIDADIATHPTSRAIQIFLGDYIDRGSNSREVIDLLIARRRRQRVICLKGNHETYIHQFLKNPSVLSDWWQLGGVNTLLSYGVAAPRNATDRQQQELANAFERALPDSHRRFFSSLPLTFTCGDFLFVHAGVRPGVPLSHQREHDLLWIRHDFLLHEDDFGKVVVHGHTPVRQPDIRLNRINIDTGAYATGTLTCLMLEGDDMVFI